MSKSAVAVLDAEAITPEVLAPQVEASWDRARQLVAEIGDWHKIIELSAVLRALREEFFNGRGGDRKSISARGNRSESGWCEVVKSELGITAQSALRAIERGTYTAQLACVVMGEEVEYETTKGEFKKIEPTPEMQEKARESLAEIVHGANAARAWAGLVGEFTRRGKYGTSERAPVDHAANLRTALVKLQTSLKNWGKISPKERAAIEELWAERVASYIPDTWTR